MGDVIKADFKRKKRLKNLYSLPMNNIQFSAHQQPSDNEKIVCLFRNKQDNNENKHP